jgi:hypothetical protein
MDTNQSSNERLIWKQIQPLITGSILTFEHEEDARKLGFDKVIMQGWNWLRKIRTSNQKNTRRQNRYSRWRKL